jgi:hypothetical protein
MSDAEDWALLINGIRRSFPAAAVKTDATMLKRGIDAEFQFLWFEVFADTTNNLLRDKDCDGAKAHLTYMSQKFGRGSDAVKKAVDSYVENLLFQFSEGDKKAAWKLFPANLKALYVAMWGEPVKL